MHSNECIDCSWLNHTWECNLVLHKPGPHTCIAPYNVYTRTHVHLCTHMNTTAHVVLNILLSCITCAKLAAMTTRAVFIQWRVQFTYMYMHLYILDTQLQYWSIVLLAGNYLGYFLHYLHCTSARERLLKWCHHFLFPVYPLFRHMDQMCTLYLHVRLLSRRKHTISHSICTTPIRPTVGVHVHVYMYMHMSIVYWYVCMYMCIYLQE